MTTTIVPKSSVVWPAGWSAWTSRVGRRGVEAALARLRHGRVELAIEGGPTLSGRGDGAGPSVRMTVRDQAFFSAAALGGTVGFAESYMEGHWTCDDLPGLIELLAMNAEALGSLGGPLAKLAGVPSRVGYWLARNTRRGSRRNIVAHYDLSNEFFSTFLDRGMVYSSAFYRSGTESLEAAQVEKMDRACRKLRLCADDHLLEIGTGWGSLAVHAASRYGCRVTTTTISDKQHEAAVRRVEAAGLSGRVRVLRQDYRDLEGRYDKLVSIEMIEAVGREYLGTFVGKCSSLLDERGLALIQGITIRGRLYEQASRRVDFLKKYIFPGSCLVGAAAFSRAVATHGDLEIVHAEHFGEHYARTLSDWRGTFLANLGRVRRLGYDDRFIRMWDYYLAYCEGAMRAGRTSVAQWLLAKPGARGGAAETWGADWGAEAPVSPITRIVSVRA